MSRSLMKGSSEKLVKLKTGLNAQSSQRQYQNTSRLLNEEPSHQPSRKKTSKDYEAELKTAIHKQKTKFDRDTVYYGLQKPSVYFKKNANTKRAMVNGEQFIKTVNRQGFFLETYRDKYQLSSVKSQPSQINFEDYINFIDQPVPDEVLSQKSVTSSFSSFNSLTSVTPYQKIRTEKGSPTLFQLRHKNRNKNRYGLRTLDRPLQLDKNRVLGELKELMSQQEHSQVLDFQRINECLQEVLDRSETKSSGSFQQNLNDYVTRKHKFQIFLLDEFQILFKAAGLVQSGESINKILEMYIDTEQKIDKHIVESYFSALFENGSYNTITQYYEEMEVELSDQISDIISPTTMNYVLMSYGHLHDKNKVIETIDSIPKKEVTVENLNAFLKALSSMMLYDDVISQFEKRSDFGSFRHFDLNAETFELLVQAYSSIGSNADAILAFEHSLKQSILSTKLVNSILEVYYFTDCTAKEFTNVANLFAEKAVVPNFWSMRLLSAHCDRLDFPFQEKRVHHRVLLGQEKVELKLAEFQNSKRPDMIINYLQAHPDLIINEKIYSQILRAYYELGDYEKVFSTYIEMVDGYKLVPDYSHHFTVLNALHQLERHDEINLILSQLLKAHDHEILLDGFLSNIQRSDDIDFVYRIFLMKLESKMVISQRHYTSLLHLLSTKAMDAAKEIETLTFNLHVQALALHPDQHLTRTKYEKKTEASAERAIESENDTLFLQEKKETEKEINVRKETVEFLSDTVFSLFDTCKKQYGGQIHTDIYTCVFLACAARNDPEKALSYFQYGKDSNVDFSLAAYSVLNHLLEDNGIFDVPKQIRNEVRSLGLGSYYSDKKGMEIDNQLALPPEDFSFEWFSVPPREVRFDDKQIIKTNRFRNENKLIREKMDQSKISGVNYSGPDSDKDRDVFFTEKLIDGQTTEERLVKKTNPKKEKNLAEETEAVLNEFK